MNKPLRILVVEDSEDDTHLLMAGLRRGGYEPVSELVYSEPTMSAALAKGDWDVVISDHSMPGFSSSSALELLKKSERDIPFIVWSGFIGEDAAVEVMKAGASDFVGKGNVARLISSIERELREAAGRRARRTAEGAVQRGQQELEDSFEHAPVGLHWEGPDGTILRVNEAELEMLGYTRGEYVGHNIAEFYAEPGAADRILDQLKRGETVQNRETWLRCKDGSVKAVMINANALWENGVFVHTRTFSRDISDRKEAEAALAYLAAIVESSEDAIIGKNLDGTITSWNQGAEHVFGYTARETIGMPGAMLLPYDRLAEQDGMLEQIRRGDAVRHFETVRRHKDGRLIDVSVTISPIRDASGKIIGASKTARDVTERKRAEEQLRASLAEKEVLLKEIHHRVKNNLQIIYSLLSLQSQHIQDPEALKSFQECQHRVKSMALLHEKLYQSRDISVIDFAGYVGSLFDYLFPTYELAGRHIERHLDIKDVALHLDEAIPCGLILNELASNSLKHAFKGRDHGRVSVQMQLESDGQYHLRFADDGIGGQDAPDFHNSQSLGVKLVDILTRQLHGTLEMHHNGGTEYHITFPSRISERQHEPEPTPNPAG